MADFRTSEEMRKIGLDAARDGFNTARKAGASEEDAEVAGKKASLAARRTAYEAHLAVLKKAEDAAIAAINEEKNPIPQGDPMRVDRPVLTEDGKIDHSFERVLLVETSIENRKRAHRRLGRHIYFDERSRAHYVVETSKALVTKIWQRTTPALDQGQLGSCTGNGAVGVLCTEPYAKPKMKYNEALARAVYSEATKLDDERGTFPPTDTGSSVLAAMKAMKKMGLISGYKWCFSANAVRQTLSHDGPVEVGFSWHAGFDNPDPRTGFVKLSGRFEGGHAFELIGIDVEKQLIHAVNSWSDAWGKKGRFCFSWDDLDTLMKDDGEAATIIV